MLAMIGSEEITKSCHCIVLCDSQRPIYQHRFVVFVATKLMHNGYLSEMMEVESANACAEMNSKEVKINVLVSIFCCCLMQTISKY